MDTSIPDRKAARFTAAAESGVNMNPARECTLADRAAWAHAALEAYNRQAPKALLPVPKLKDQ
ncbi:hypothetical protein ABZS79_30565 [Streptomyces griseoloalbus]|uniref:hypothetical protein n=1 Tax=Streptomyces griseoloalbus TaxID=67303 RepID=UPI00339E2594